MELDSAFLVGLASLLLALLSISPAVLKRNAAAMASNLVLAARKVSTGAISFFKKNLQSSFSGPVQENWIAAVTEWSQPWLTAAR